jgi:protein subunit release factor A
MEYSANKINKNGEIVVTSQESRTQSSNKEDCVEKLQAMIAEAYVEPKERAMWQGLSMQGKSERRSEKRKRGDVKSTRSRKIDYDD